MVRFRLCLASMLVLALSHGSSVSGGDGFPPFGAWVYGTGHVTPRVKHVRTVARVHPYGWHGWSGYSNVGLVTTTRIRYRGFHHHHWSHHHRPYVAYRVHYPSFLYYRSYPTFIYPIYTRPVYPAPIFYTPTCPATSVSVGFNLADKQRLSHRDAASTIAANSRGSAPQLNLLGVSFANVPAHAQTASRLIATQATASQTAVTQAAATQVVTDPQTMVGNQIPARILRVADTILRIGGYREAAQAYARLSNKYGTSDLIYGRRFVAQAAAGDLAQAEVVLELATASGFAIRAADLPGGNLDEILPAPNLVTSVTERLAKRALERTDDPVPLKSVATWLALTGDADRAAIFRRRAEQLEQQNIAAPELNLNKTVLAYFE